MSCEQGSYAPECAAEWKKPSVESLTSPEKISKQETAQIAKEIRGITLTLREQTFVEDLPTDLAEPLGEKESPGPWSTYYYPTRCCNSEHGLCSVCGYTTLRKDISNEEIVASNQVKTEEILGDFKKNVIDRQYGKMANVGGVENPVGLTMSPTGSFFAENEFPMTDRIQLLQRILEESQNHEVDLVFTAEAHARDVVKKSKTDYFEWGQGREEAELLRSLHAQIILGFESQNDFVRNGIYSKNLNLRDFDQAVQALQEQDLSVGAFVFGGLAPMTDLESKQDILESIKYLHEKGVFPVTMFANIQPNTITDVLRENDRYKMLEPFTVADTIDEMLTLITIDNEDANWLIPDPVGGPPEPVHNIFLGRLDAASSEKTNIALRDMLYELRNTRDIKTYQDKLAELRQTNEYKNYQEVLNQQQEATEGKSLLVRTQEMLDFLKKSRAVENYLTNE
ncbi:MAG: hypothetical protein LBG64_04010 [Pseudomonadales bacterium]|nr:hypothetical protein [Pseudomonadales bacterium]